MFQQNGLGMAFCFRKLFGHIALYSAGLLALHPANAADISTTLPPILNFHPECEPTIITEITQTRYEQDFEQGNAESAAKAKAAFLQHLRQKAAAQGADALILNEMKSSIEFGERRKGQHRLKIVGSAQLLNFCQHNRELSTRSTRWNEHGDIQTIQDPAATAFSISITSQSGTSQTAAKALAELSSDISLSGGAFGLRPGMTRAQVQQLLGMADAQVQLQSGLIADGYGRQLWLIFNDTLQQIQTDRRFLSGYGQNLLAFHDHFDSNPWLAEGKVGYKTPLAAVRQQLPQAVESGRDRWQLSNQQHQLQLLFEHFNPAHQQPAVPMLTGFLLKHAAEKPLSLQVAPVETKLYFQVLQQLQPKQFQQAPRWSELTIPATLAQHQFRLDKAQWRMLGDYLQFQLEDDQVKKLRIADSIFFHPQQSSIFNELYQALGLPAKKQQLLDMFSDGELYHQQFNLYRDSFHLQISFDSDADDATAEEVILSYF